ncbi:MAG: hypothetical protein AAFR21_16660 [Pseudomonadota bacterium]
MRDWEWCRDVDCVIAWAFDWQTLISGLLALLAAFYSIIMIQKQIKQTHDQRQDNIGRRHRAIKAGTTLALDEIIQYAEDCFKLLGRNWNPGSGPNSTVFPDVAGTDIPTFPYSAFDKVREAIETADKDDATVLAAFISYSQVHKARFEQMFDNSNETNGTIHLSVRIPDLRQRAFESAFLYGTASWLLEYCRGDPERLDEFPDCNTAGRLRAKCRQLNIDQLFQIAQSRWPNSREGFMTKLRGRPSTLIRSDP